MTPEEFISQNSYYVATNLEQAKTATELVNKGVLKSLSEIKINGLTNNQVEATKLYYVLSNVKNHWQIPIVLQHLLESQKKPKVGDIGTIVLTHHTGQKVNIMVKLKNIRKDRAEVVIINTNDCLYINLDEFQL